jgi:hypothetical protein
MTVFNISNICKKVVSDTGNGNHLNIAPPNHASTPSPTNPSPSPSPRSPAHRFLQADSKPRRKTSLTRQQASDVLQEAIAFVHRERTGNENGNGNGNGNGNER